MSTPGKPARTGGKRTRTKNAKTATAQTGNNAISETVRLHLPEQAMPDFCGKRVLDMGCHDGWHCRYAIEHGAIACTGIEASETLIRQAMRRNASFWTEYRCAPLENPDVPPQTCDVAICAYALDEHPEPETVLAHIRDSLIPGGILVLCVRHPLHTATGTPDTATKSDDTSAANPLTAATLFARYFDESERAPAKDTPAPCRHRTTATLVNSVIAAGFTLTGLSEHAPIPAHTDATPTPGNPRRPRHHRETHRLSDDTLSRRNPTEKPPSRTSPPPDPPLATASPHPQAFPPQPATPLALPRSPSPPTSPRDTAHPSAATPASAPCVRTAIRHTLSQRRGILTIHNLTSGRHDTPSVIPDIPQTGTGSKPTDHCL